MVMILWLSTGAFVAVVVVDTVQHRRKSLTKR
jgi:hypothetical protein